MDTSVNDAGNKSQSEANAPNGKPGSAWETIGEPQTVRSAAYFWHSLGINIVPIHGPSAKVDKAGKRPIHDDWQRANIGGLEIDDHFGKLNQPNGHNLGLVLGKQWRDSEGILVDIDLDRPEAIALADRFLPPTLTSGRPSKPRSHRWYEVTGGDQTQRFELPGAADALGKMVVELRAGGGLQTVVPPSIHPSGEKLVWDNWGIAPAKIGYDNLLKGVTRLAIASALAYEWPAGENNNRSEMAMAVAGMLIRAGLSDGEAEDIVRAFCAYKDPENADERVAKIAQTRKRMAQEKNFSGGNHLIELGADEKNVNRIREWLGGNAKKDADKRVYRPLADFGMRANKHVSIETPPETWIIDQIIKKPSTAIVHAWVGLGKTRLAWEMARAVATGTELLGVFDVPEALNVLLIDGEMGTGDIKDIEINQLRGQGCDRIEVLDMEQVERGDEPPLNLAKEEHQLRVETYLADLAASGFQVDLIIFDNYSFLVHGIDQNDNTAQESVLLWLKSLKFRGYTSLLIDHDNKTGGLAGASAKQRPVNTVIQLVAPEKMPAGFVVPEPIGRGARFVMTFPKTRGLRTEHPYLLCELWYDEHGEARWFTQDLVKADGKSKPHYWTVLKDVWDQKGVAPLRDIATRTKVPFATVQRDIANSRKAGDLAADKVTDKGQLGLSQFYSDVPAPTVQDDFPF